MRRAVLHVNLDHGGVVPIAELAGAIEHLRRCGFIVIDTDLDRLPRDRREVEVHCDGDDVKELRERVHDACVAALAAAGCPTTPRVLAVSFVSSGSDEDAWGVVRAFGLDQHVAEIRLLDDDVAVLIGSTEILRSGALGKLHTALEATLNREVRLSAATGRHSAPAPSQ
jgi:hypothetical protein